MHKGYRYRIYPNKEQQAFFQVNFDACRLVYNLALETKVYAYRSYGTKLSEYDLKNQLVELKQQCRWLKKAIAKSLQITVRHLEKAYLHFFKKEQSFPRFKKKTGQQSFTVDQGGIRLSEDGKLLVPKCSPVRVRLSHPLVGTVKKATISRTTTGRYYVSFIADNGLSEPPKRPVIGTTAVGIDLGIKHHITTSKGQTFQHVNITKSNPIYQRIQILSRRLRRKVKGSGKRKKLILRIAKLYERQRNRRNDAIHKITSELVNNHDTICLETLRISNMMKHPTLARSIHKSALSEIVRQVSYKARWQGKNVLRVPTHYPSTKTCSGCGKLADEVPLRVRVYRCECGAELDRDLNAAINIKNEALRRYTGADCPVVPVELPTIVGTMKRELRPSQPT